jgi:hypothetical protein
VNPFREPQLLAFLAEARDRPEAHQVSFLAAADWCEERGEDELAAGLRRLVALGLRPHHHAATCGWRWLSGSRSQRCFLETEAHHRLKGWVYRSLDRFSHYSTFAGAVLAAIKAIRPQPTVTQEPLFPQDPFEEKIVWRSS